MVRGIAETSSAETNVARVTNGSLRRVTNAAAKVRRRWREEAAIEEEEAGGFGGDGEGFKAREKRASAGETQREWEERGERCGGKEGAGRGKGESGGGKMETGGEGDEAHAEAKATSKGGARRRERIDAEGVPDAEGEVEGVDGMEELTVESGNGKSEGAEVTAEENEAVSRERRGEGNKARSKEEKEEGTDEREESGRRRRERNGGENPKSLIVAEREGEEERVESKAIQIEAREYRQACARKRWAGSVIGANIKKNGKRREGRGRGRAEENERGRR